LTVSPVASTTGVPLVGLLSVFQHPAPEEGHVKSDEEIMEVLEAFNLTGSYRDTAELAGCSSASNSFPGSSTKIVQGCVYSPRACQSWFSSAEILTA
jgi:hypothetical protein